MRFIFNLFIGLVLLQLLVFLVMAAYILLTGVI